MRYSILFILFLLAGCPLEDNGLSRTDVQQMLDPLESRIDALETANAALQNQIDNKKVGDRVGFDAGGTLGYFPLGSLGPIAAGTAPPSASIGTLMQYSYSHPGSARGIAVKMDTGYLVSFDMARTPTGYETFLAHSTQVLYESADCGAGGDSPFLWADTVGVQAQIQGHAVRAPSVGLTHDLSDASTYWYFAPGTAVESVTISSVRTTSMVHNREVFCSPTGPAVTDVIRLIPNDPGVTGVPSGPWNGVPIITSN